MQTNVKSKIQNAMVTRRFHDRHHSYEFLLGCELGRMYIENPAMIEKVREYLNEIRGNHSQRHIFETWNAIVDLPIEEVAARLAQNDDEGDWIRQSAPPVHVIPIERRQVLMEQAKQMIHDQAN